MNILMINTTDLGGGAAQICFSLGDQLVKNGHKVNYLVGYKYSRRSDVDVIAMPKFLTVSPFLQKCVLYTRHLRSFFVSDDISFGDNSQIFNNFWYKKADVVHIHNRHGSFIKLSAIKKISQEKKSLWTMHDSWVIAPKSAIIPGGDVNQDKPKFYPPMRAITNKYQKKKTKLLTNMNIQFISPSNWLISQNQKKLINPIKVIPNGIHRSNILPQPINQPLKAIFVATDQNAKDKGLDYARLLAKKFTNIKWHWLGTNQSFDPDFTIVPYQPNHDNLITILNQMDMLIYPSIVDNFPTLIIESMSLGKYIVAFQVGGIPEIVTHKQNGYMAKYKDQLDLSKGIEFFLSLDEKQRDEIKKQNIQKVKQNFILDEMANSYEKLYDSLKAL